MEAWIREHFDIEKPFPYETEEYIVVDEKTSLYLPMFLDYVAGLETPLTVEKLKAVDPEDSRGWFAYFDKWKTEGILN